MYILFFLSPILLNSLLAAIKYTPVDYVMMKKNYTKLIVLL